MHLMIYFQLNDLEIRKHYNRTQKRLKLGMVSSLEPHSMCAKVERITAKTGCTSCTNWTISFKVQGFQTKTHLYLIVKEDAFRPFFRPSLMSLLFLRVLMTTSSLPLRTRAKGLLARLRFELWPFSYQVASPGHTTKQFYYLK